MTLTLLTILVIALVIQGFCFGPAVAAFAGNGLGGRARRALQRFPNALIISAAYKITWLVGAPLTVWIWHAAFHSGSAAILLMVLAAVLFFVWPGLSLKLASALFPRRLGRYSWGFAMEMGVVMALVHIVFSCIWYLVWILI